VPYIGLGPSAHSFDGSARRWNTREYAAWRERTLTGEDPVEGTETLDTEAVAIEEAYLGLRTSNGLALNPANTSDFERWGRRGWAIVSDGIGRLTPEGWLRLDAITADLTDVRSR
jgi:oxygen-independent coproporphyrinogen-3 oxidase